MTDMRNDIAKARDKWLESEDGKTSAEGYATGQYLKNRLERAFIAGWNAAAKAKESK